MFYELDAQSKENFLKKRFGHKIKFAGLKSPQIKKIRDIASNKKGNIFLHVVTEGVWANGLALKNNAELVYTILNVDSITSPEATNIAFELISKSDFCYLISEKTLNATAETGNSSGIISVFALRRWTLEDLYKDGIVKGGASEFVVILDGLEIPGNVGTVVRSADGTDASAVIVTNKKTRLTHPKYIRSSQGSAFKVPVVETTVTETAKFLNQLGYHIYLADTAAADPYYSPEYSGPTAIVMGSERYGICRQWYSAKNSKAIYIPMFGDCDSLNVGIAATVLMYQVSLTKKNMITHSKSKGRKLPGEG